MNIRSLITALLLVSSAVNVEAQRNALKPSDFEPLTSLPWKGPGTTLESVLDAIFREPNLAIRYPVLAEVCDGLADPLNRQFAVHLVDRIATAGPLRAVQGSDELFERGFALYRQRVDKDWSLTDCISFVVMADESLTDALTADHHFAQAGFTVLLA